MITLARVDKSALHDFVDGQQVTEQHLDQNFEVLRTAINDSQDQIENHTHDGRYYKKEEVDRRFQDIVAGQIPPGSITREMLSFQPAATDESNTWTKEQTFADGVQLGNNNQDISKIAGLMLPIDTLMMVVLDWNESGLPTIIEYRDPNNLETRRSTIDFKGKTIGSKNNPNVARSKISSKIEGPSTFTTEFTDEQYQNIYSDNGVGAYTTATNEGEYAQHLFQFNVLDYLKTTGQIPQSWDLNKLLASMTDVLLTAVFSGYGASDGSQTNGAKAKLWNNETGTWYEIGSTNQLNWSASDFSKFINSDGVVYLLTHAEYPSDGSVSSQISSDYVSLEVTLKMEKMIANVQIVYNAFDKPTTFTIQAKGITITVNNKFQGTKLLEQSKVVSGA